MHPEKVPGPVKSTREPRLHKAWMLLWMSSIDESSNCEGARWVCSLLLAFQSHFSASGNRDACDRPLAHWKMPPVCCTALSLPCEEKGLQRADLQFLPATTAQGQFRPGRVTTSCKTETAYGTYLENIGRMIDLSSRSREQTLPTDPLESDPAFSCRLYKPNDANDHHQVTLATTVTRR